MVERGCAENWLKGSFRLDPLPRHPIASFIPMGFQNYEQCDSSLEASLDAFGHCSANLIDSCVSVCLFLPRSGALRAS